MVKCGDQFEITLDHRKLKTPGGSVFSVGSEALAAAIAFEWESQRDLVMPSQMHLTTMCNTSIDNPTNATKYDLVDSVLSFLDTDTLLFFSEVLRFLFLWSSSSLLCSDWLEHFEKVISTSYVQVKMLLDHSFIILS